MAICSTLGGEDIWPGKEGDSKGVWRVLGDALSSGVEYIPAVNFDLGSLCLRLEPIARVRLTVPNMLEDVMRDEVVIFELEGSVMIDEEDR